MDFIDICCLEKNDIKRINRVIDMYPITWEHCADIMELLGPIALQLSSSGVIDWIKTNAKQDTRLQDLY